MAIRGAMKSKTVRTGFSIEYLKCCPTVNSQPRKYLIKSLRVSPGMFSIAAEDSAVWVKRLKGICMQGGTFGGGDEREHWNLALGQLR